MTSSSTGGKGGREHLKEFTGDIKLEEVVRVLEGSTAIQEDLNKLEKWAGRNVMKFNNDKGKVLCCLQNTHSQCRLAANCLENTFARNKP